MRETVPESLATQTDPKPAAAPQGFGATGIRTGEESTSATTIAAMSITPLIPRADARGSA